MKRCVDNLNCFPAVSFSHDPTDLEVNFGANPFLFNVDNFVSQELQKEFTSIQKRDTNEDEMFSLVHNYLIQSGYVNALSSFEKEASFDKIKE